MELKNHTSLENDVCVRGTFARSDNRTAILSAYFEFFVRHVSNIDGFATA